MSIDLRSPRSLLASLAALAAFASVGSLYFSEGLGLVPCDLCWYQRILMYPLVAILGVAAYERRTTAWLTALPFSALGLSVAVYHSYLQVSPAGGTCTVGGGCTTILYSTAGGLLTIPRLSAIAFALLTVGVGYLAVLDRSA
ncbi:disulfide bond formation protein B [Haloferacaceae archaeon DSL9]